MHAKSTFHFLNSDKMKIEIISIWKPTFQEYDQYIVVNQAMLMLTELYHLTKKTMNL